MHKLRQFRLCPHSRAVRLALGEYGIAFELVEEQPWAWRAEFLALNPAGELPVLEIAGGPVLCGLHATLEFLAEEPYRHPATDQLVRLLPADREQRAEVRRLLDWFARKLDREVTQPLLADRVYAALGRAGAALADPRAVHAIQANLDYHLGYVAFLAYQRRWLAGDEMGLADLVAAAQLSVADYFGAIAWGAHPVAKDWYSRIKSRPSLRPLLADRVPGLPPPLAYTNLDF